MGIRSLASCSSCRKTQEPWPPRQSLSLYTRALEQELRVALSVALSRVVGVLQLNAATLFSTATSRCRTLSLVGQIVLVHRIHLISDVFA